jgi:arylsulfatase A-like enzyme
MLFLLVAACFFVGNSSARAAESAVRPNIIIFLSDDQGWSHIGYQNPKIKTALGVRLDRHYVAPSCSPTRAALMSGRCWSRFGLPTPIDSQVFPFSTVTMASMLKSVGYRTYIAGKWHLGSTADCGPLKFGFDHSFGSLVGGMGPYTHEKKRKGVSVLTRDDQPVKEEGHITDLITNEVIKWIDTNGSDPFFIYVPYTAPHIPLDEKPRWMDLYKDAPDVGHQLYWAAISHMDDGIGQIMASVEKAGKTQDTLVLFFGDNGAPGQYNQAYVGDYVKTKLPADNGGLRGRKLSLYEGGIRTPAFVTWPRAFKPATVSQPLFVADWVPTFAAIIGYKPEKDPKWDGRDLSPVLEGTTATAEPRDIYLLNYDGTALISDKWKLMLLHSKNKPTQNARTELYDLQADQYEKHNLAAANPQLVKDFTERTNAERAKDNDAVVKGAKGAADDDK